MGSAHPNGGMMPMYEGFLEHFGANVRIFGLEYRLSSAAPFPPANSFPASLINAIAGYRYFIEDVGFEPHQIILFGDSAGGGIAFNLARYLAVANLSRLRQAGGMMLLSPTMDWAGTHDDGKAVKDNARSDFVQPVVNSGYTRRALLGDLPSEEFAAKSVWISPGSRVAEWEPGMFAGVPRTVMVAGGAECTLDLMHAARDRLLRDLGGGRFEYIEVPDATHDFLPKKWHEPERSNTFV
ncbi:hypothetical protein BN946_scf184979.g35 [Trametes cinnabarina]|uniref:Alpha/beta hydrolase fold-3 domain-containing protein n=1 Tax=Pycnoporus cinnabarinus TaxID=5643 RepID=A0A060SJA1_PYCCI|nr:hypothetical protein BN946_scf184979.g35 [Trametes cinnabarina]